MFLLFESSFDADSSCDSSSFNIEMPTQGFIQLLCLTTFTRTILNNI